MITYFKKQCLSSLPKDFFHSFLQKQNKATLIVLRGITFHSLFFTRPLLVIRCKVSPYSLQHLLTTCCKFTRYSLLVVGVLFATIACYQLQKLLVANQIVMKINHWKHCFLELTKLSETFSFLILLILIYIFLILVFNTAICK